MEKLTRRNFFKLAGGGVAAAIVAPQTLLGEPISGSVLASEASGYTQVPVEFGWTWHVDKTKVPSTLSEIITKTLRENSHKLRDNLSQNNALLMKLKDNQKVLLRVEKISPEEQTKRMGDRIELRRAERQAKRLRDKIKNGGKLYPVDTKANPFYDGYEDIEKRFS